MDGNAFGSVLDLKAFLEDGSFDDVENDAFLKDMGNHSFSWEGLDFPRDFAGKASSHTSSLSGMGFDASNDEADNFPTGTAPLQYSSGLPLAQTWPATMPMSTAAPGPAPFKQNAAESTANSAALLSQLVAALQANAPKKLETAAKQEAVNMLAVAKPAGNMTLPSLSAQQQQALQTIMSMGSLGATPEGKKVRRMLSNRESARRSRHRKQAHVHTLEEKVLAIEAENQSLKSALSRMNDQEVQNANERMQLHAEVASLRVKIAQMEQASSCAIQQKRAAGSDASTKGESLSFDSCCASRLGTEHHGDFEYEHCSKKKRT